MVRQVRQAQAGREQQPERAGRKRVGGHVVRER